MPLFYKNEEKVLEEQKGAVLYSYREPKKSSEPNKYHTWKVVYSNLLDPGYPDMVKYYYFKVFARIATFFRFYFLGYDEFECKLYRINSGAITETPDIYKVDFCLPTNGDHGHLGKVEIKEIQGRLYLSGALSGSSSAAYFKRRLEDKRVKKIEVVISPSGDVSANAVTWTEDDFLRNSFAYKTHD